MILYIVSDLVPIALTVITDHIALYEPPNTLVGIVQL